MSILQLPIGMPKETAPKDKPILVSYVSFYDNKLCWDVIRWYDDNSRKGWHSVATDGFFDEVYLYDAVDICQFPKALDWQWHGVLPETAPN